MANNINIKKGFTQIDSNWIDGQEISDGAFRTLVVLKSFQYGSNKIFPSIATIAKKRGRTITTIINHLNELRGKKYIESKRRGYSASNIYTIINQKNLTTDKNNNQKNYTTNIKETGYQYSNNFEPNNTTNNTKLIIDKKPIRGDELKITTDEIRKRLSWMQHKKTTYKDV